MNQCSLIGQSGSFNQKHSGHASPKGGAAKTKCWLCRLRLAPLATDASSYIHCPMEMLLTANQWIGQEAGSGEQQQRTSSFKHSWCEKKFDQLLVGVAAKQRNLHSSTRHQRHNSSYAWKSGLIRCSSTHTKKCDGGATGSHLRTNGKHLACRKSHVGQLMND